MDKLIYSSGNGVIIRSLVDTDVDRLLQNFLEQSWNKPREVIERYLARQNNGELHVFVAEYNDDVGGYTVLYPEDIHGPFVNKKIPLISDLVVFEKYQKRGIGNRILDAAEKKAAEMSDTVSLGVGLHRGYGPAQRIYIKRGYMPDGSGVWYQDKPLEPYTECKNDDDLILYLSKKLC